MSDYLLRMNGGPHPGDRIVSSVLMPWPPADEMPDEGGRYVKTSQSQITDDQAETLTFVLRGADYAWRPDPETVPA